MDLNFVYIGLGSNLGNRVGNLVLAKSFLSKTLFDMSCSNFYETKPLYNLNQPDFLNQVIKGRTYLDPVSLLSIVQGIQKTLGQTLKTEKNMPRLIDIDILDYKGWFLNLHNLTLPHPLIKERSFVLKPLHEIDSLWTLEGKTAKEWLDLIK